MGVDECRSTLCKQLFKLGWSSMCDCSHHGLEWRRVVVPRRPQASLSSTSSNPSSRSVPERLNPEQLYDWISSETTGSDHTMAHSAHWYASDT